MVACRKSNTANNLRIVKLLLNNGADINLQNNIGWTSLMFAAKYSNTSSNNETVRVLLNNGADVNLQNNDGWTSLMYAARYSKTSSNNETVQLLLNGGANVNLQNNIGWTSLMYTARYSNTDSNNETVSILLNGGANVNLKNNNGWTSLMCKFTEFDEDEDEDDDGININNTLEILLKYGAYECLNNFSIIFGNIDTKTVTGNRIAKYIHENLMYRDNYEFTIKHIHKKYTNMLYAPNSLRITLKHIHYSSIPYAKILQTHNWLIDYLAIYDDHSLQYKLNDYLKFMD